jgi:RNA polymerase sigma-70 factor (ECF subfamily)
MLLVSEFRKNVVMPRVPETRASLILRLPSAADAEAWQEFVTLYEPFIYRFARRGGLQDADASELVQNVMLAVARAVGRWKPDPARARFRTWLFRIARNQLRDALDALHRHDRFRSAPNDSTLHRVSAPEEFTEEQIRTEARREVFRSAAERIRPAVKESTWQAFWLTAVEARDADSVARELGLSPAAVYIARSRILARLRHEVRRWENDDALS